MTIHPDELQQLPISVLVKGVATEIVAIVHPAWKVTAAQLEAPAARFAAAEMNMAVVPLGLEGEQLWSEFPSNLGLLAAPPGRLHAVLVRAGTSSLNPEDFWQSLLVQPSQSIQLQAAIRPAAGAGPELPLLAPPRGRAPRFLAVYNRAARLLDGKLQSAADGLSLEAGIWQLHDELERSHQCAQQVEGEGRRRAGDYWHAIMHRREPDYSNAKYWFRRVGLHPVMTQLAGIAKTLGDSASHPDIASWQQRISATGWNSLAFVDLCEVAAAQADSPLDTFARRLQYLEMLLLLRATLDDARG